MDDIAQECDDAVFAVCDARERYPTECANLLAHCIAVENEIWTAPIKKETVKNLKPLKLTIEQENLFANLETMDNKKSSVERNKKLLKLTKKIVDLKIVKDQIDREKQGKSNNESVNAESSTIRK